MAIEVETEFKPTDTVIIMYYNYDSSDDLTDATAVKVTVVDPDGTTQVDASAMTKDSTGTYSYKYNKGATPSMATGEWQIRVDATSGTGADTITSSFTHSFTVV